MLARQPYIILKKQGEKILKVFMKSDLSQLMTKQKTLHNAKCVTINKVLVEWIRQLRLKNFLLDWRLMAQSKNFHKQLNIEAICKYSSGWYIINLKRGVGCVY